MSIDLTTQHKYVRTRTHSSYSVSPSNNNFAEFTYIVNLPQTMKDLLHLGVVMTAIRTVSLRAISPKNIFLVLHSGKFMVSGLGYNGCLSFILSSPNTSCGTM